MSMAIIILIEDQVPPRPGLGKARGGGDDNEGGRWLGVPLVCGGGGPAMPQEGLADHNDLLSLVQVSVAAPLNDDSKEGAVATACGEFGEEVKPSARWRRTQQHW